MNPLPPAERFRSVSDFPPSIAELDRPEAEALYEEMRACLTFTNRSRAQQMRRKEQYKQSTIALQSDVVRLQDLIQQLATDKGEISQTERDTITALEAELTQMSGRLDRFSHAFDDVEALQNPMELMANPGRFIRFWKALKDLIMWWREMDETDRTLSATPLTPEQLAQDRRDNPQMYNDIASVQRSLRDN
jgi:DNA repair exonuclease SbcCD ATPase subunit